MLCTGNEGTFVTVPPQSKYPQITQPTLSVLQSVSACGMSANITGNIQRSFGGTIQAV